MCREYILGPGAKHVDAPLGKVGRGVVSDTARRQQTEIDVVVTEDGKRGRVALLGEAKWGRTMGVDQLARLDRAREVLGGQGREVGDCVLACFSGVGFSDELRAAEAERDDVLLVTLADLYEGVADADR